MRRRDRLRPSLASVLLGTVILLGCGGCSSRAESNAGSPGGNSPSMTAYDPGLLYVDPPGYIAEDLR